QIVYPLSNLINFWAAIQDGLTHAGRVFEMADPKENKQPIEGKGYESQKLNIVMDNITYGYKNVTQTIKNISFEFQHGYTTAIVGPSGGGKSTILKLLSGLYEPDSGVLRTGNSLIDQRTRGTWRHRVSYLAQDTDLLHASVIENI